MRRWTKRLLILGVIAVVALILSFTVFRPAPVSVTVFRVERGRVEDTVVNSRAGTVESRFRARMSPAIAGLVAEIPVEKGQRVRRGTVLLKLDDSELKPQVILAERSVDAARAAADEACLSARQASRERRRAEALGEQDLISEQGLEEARTRSESLEAACTAATETARQAEASLSMARANLEKAVMSAPFDGVVLDITTEVGEWISPSPPGVFIPPVIDLVAPDSLYVSAPLDEVDVARVRLGQPVRVALDAFRGRAFRGVLTYISSFVETTQEQNRTLRVEAVLEEADLPQNLLPGLSADIEVILQSRDDVLRIPSYALLEGDKVLQVNGDELVEVPVEVGLRNWEYAEVLSGLVEGDRVVVSLDRPEVVAGAKVRVTGESES